MMNRVVCFCLAVWPCLAASAAGEPARDPANPSAWPQFRGPDGLGIAAERVKLPTHFGPSDHVLWITPLPPGHSSPCIWQARIFLTAFEPQTRQLETICLDRASGKILWRQTAPAEKIEHVHELNNPASSTPATDGERVYVYFGSYGLLCYDFGGQELWKRPLAPIPGFFGSGTSPIAAGDFVLLNSGEGNLVFTLLAFHARTGEIAWQKQRGRGFSTGLWSTPLVRRVDGGDEVVVLGGGGGGISAYNLADGSDRWKVQGLPPISLSTPTAGAGLLFCSLTNPIGEPDNVIKLPSFDAALKEFDADGDGKIAVAEVPKDRNVFGRGREDKIGDWSPLGEMMPPYDKDRDGALDNAEWQALTKSLTQVAESVQIAVIAVRLDGQGDVSKSHVVWQQTKAVPEVPSPLCYEGRVYLVSEKGIVTCCDARTGEQRYRQRLGVRGTCYASPVVGDGKIYAASDGGTVVVFKPGDRFELLAKNEFDEGVVATPALVDDKIYIRTERRLYACGD